MLNQRLSQKLLQKLSPQQIQLMKLLQVPTANLRQNKNKKMKPQISKEVIRPVIKSCKTKITNTDC